VELFIIEKDEAKHELLAMDGSRVFLPRKYKTFCCADSSSLLAMHLKSFIIVELSLEIKEEPPSISFYCNHKKNTKTEQIFISIVMKFCNMYLVDA